MEGQQCPPNTLHVKIVTSYKPRIKRNILQNHWIAKSVLYKDLLKEGQGTEFFIDTIVIHTAIPDYLFSKTALKK
jgi:hypothetical protein